MEGKKPKETLNKKEYPWEVSGLTAAIFIVIASLAYGLGSLVAAHLPIPLKDEAGKALSTAHIASIFLYIEGSFALEKANGSGETTWKTMLCFLWAITSLMPTGMVGAWRELLAGSAAVAIILPLLLLAGKHLTDPKYRQAVNWMYYFSLPIAMINMGGPYISGIILVAAVLSLVRYGFKSDDVKNLNRPQVIYWAVRVGFDALFILWVGLRVITGLSTSSVIAE